MRLDGHCQLLSTDTLFEPGRVNRPALRTWAAMLVDRLRALPSGREGWLPTSGYMNNTGLIEVFRGNPRGAHDACANQLRWAKGLIASHGSARAGQFLIQPWVNLGRLHRIEKNYDAALRHFSLIEDTLAQRPCVLAGMTLDAAEWQAVSRTDGWFSVLKNIYIVDSVKTHWAMQSPSEALDFLRCARARFGDEALPSIDEMEVLTLGKLGRLSEAAQVLDRDVWNDSGLSKLIRITYRAGLHAASGNTSHAQRLLTELATRVLGNASFETPRDQNLLRYLHYLGGLASRLDLRDIAGATFSIGLRGARHLDDVPCRLGFLDAMIESDGLGDRETLEAERDDVLRECLYVPLLAARGMTVSPAALADPIFAELRSRLQTIADSAQSSARQGLAERLASHAPPSA